MINFNKEYIEYRIAKSQEAFEDANYLISQQRWNAAVNRLYYACFYITTALLLKSEIDSKTHAGIKTQLNLKFIKTGILSPEYGRTYTDLFDSRQRGDYGDMFDFDKDSVETLKHSAENFIQTIMSLIAAK